MSSDWEQKNRKRYKPLEESIDTDVLVIGGGLAGIWTAYKLSESGRKVVVLEKDRVGGGETEYTTAFITQSIDTPLAELVKIFGERTARLVWRSHNEAIDEIEKVILKEQIECEFMRLPVYIYASTDKEFKSLQEEHRWARKFEFRTKVMKNLTLDFVHAGVLSIEDQAKYHPIKFIAGLAEAAARQGTQIFERSEVINLSGNGPFTATTSKGQKVKAKEVVIATYDPLGNPRPTKMKKGMYLTFIYELEVKKDELQEGLYMDMMNPYHYVRVDKRGMYDRVLVGGEDFREEFRIPPAKSYQALEQYIKNTYPNLKYKVVKKWKGRILEPSDGLALMGRYARGRYVACAFSGNGMTYAPIAGNIISDQMLGRRNPYTKIYNPSRKLKAKALLYKARDYAGEFFGGAVKNLLK